MRIATIVLCLAALSGCQAAPAAPSAPSTPAAPSAPSTPAAPSAPAVSKPVAPSTPAAPAAPVVAKLPAAPAAKPVVADLSKGKGPAEGAELFGYDDGNSRFFYYTAGAVEFPVKVEADGVYEIAVKVSCDEAKGEKAKFTVAVDGQKAGGEITSTTTDEKEYVVKAEVKAGNRTIAVAFLNDLYKENEYDLNMYVSGLALRPAK
jgi:hypothetical protein